MINLHVQNKMLEAGKENFYYLLTEVIKKSKKIKPDQLENALMMLNEADQDQVIGIFKSLNFKYK